MELISLSPTWLCFKKSSASTLFVLIWHSLFCSAGWSQTINYRAELSKQISYLGPSGMVMKWVNANSNGPFSPDGKLELSLEVETRQSISTTDFNWTLNGIEPAQLLESSLSQLNANKYRYRALLKIENGISKLNVCTRKNGKTKCAQSLLIEKRFNRIFIDQGDNLIIANRPIISWITPEIYDSERKTHLIKSKEVEIKLHIGGINTPLQMDDLRVYQNGEKLDMNNAFLRQNGEIYIFSGIFSITDIYREQKIHLDVNTSSGVFSSDTLVLKYSSKKPVLYVLSIGAASNLQFTAQDAKDFAAIFEQQQNLLPERRLFDKVVIKKLTGEDAKAESIRKQVAEMAYLIRSGEIDPDDVVLLFISTHGFIDNSELRLQGFDYQTNLRGPTSVSFKKEILEELANVPCKKIIFVDACHGGGAKNDVRDINAEISRMNEVSSGVAVLASCQEDEEAYEDGSWGNGAFTEALIEGLKNGKADANNDQIIRIEELNKYLQQRVPEMVLQVKGKIQTPVLTKNELGDLPLFIVNQ